SALSRYDCNSLKALELIGQVRLCLKKRTGRVSDSASASLSSGMLCISAKPFDKSRSLLVKSETLSQQLRCSRKEARAKGNDPTLQIETAARPRSHRSETYGLR